MTTTILSIKNKEGRIQKIAPYALLLPSLIVLGFFMFWPFLYTIYLSFLIGIWLVQQKSL